MEVKTCKAHQITRCSEHFWNLKFKKRTAFGPNTCRNQCAQSTSAPVLVGVEIYKKCTRLWREACFEVKMYKTPQLRSTLAIEIYTKMHAVVARSIILVLLKVETHVEDMPKTPHVRSTSGRSDAVSPGRRHGFCTLPTMSKTYQNVTVFWHLQKGWQAWDV